MDRDEVTLEDIDRYIEKLSLARQRISVLEEENESLKSKLDGAQEKLSLLEHLKTDFGKLKSESEGLALENKDLKSKLSEAQEKLSSLEQFKVKFTDLSEGMTLEGAKAKFLEVEEDAIYSKVEKVVKELRKRDEEYMPQLISNRLTQTLEAEEWPEEIANAVGRAAQRQVFNILYSREKWPEPFVLYYQGELNEGIQQGLNAEFSRRVGEGVRATFDQLKASEWKRYSDQKLQPILDKSLGDFLARLKGQRRPFQCSYCQQGFEIEMTPKVMTAFLTQGWIELVCPNVNCREENSFYRLLHGENPRRKIRIYLKTVLEGYFGSYPEHEESRW